MVAARMPVFRAEAGSGRGLWSGLYVWQPTAPVVLTNVSIEDAGGSKDVVHDALNLGSAAFTKTDGARPGNKGFVDGWRILTFFGREIGIARRHGESVVFTLRR